MSKQHGDCFGEEKCKQTALLYTAKINEVENKTFRFFRSDLSINKRYLQNGKQRKNIQKAT